MGPVYEDAPHSLLGGVLFAYRCGMCVNPETSSCVLEADDFKRRYVDCCYHSCCCLERDDDIFCPFGVLDLARGHYNTRLEVEIDAKVMCAWSVWLREPIL